MRELGEKLKNMNELKLVDKNTYCYKQQSGNKIKIDSSERTCSCAVFHQKLVCKHLVAACLLDHVRLKGLEVFPGKLKKVRQRQKRQNRYLDASLDSQNK